jgi:V/A-type H+-transporting ATPase subunit A
MMGLKVLLLADSTSRWAQALREMSGRLEEIPGEEAFPAYLESVVASFYERAGIIKLNNGATGSITIGGAVSPAGGNFDEPVTQATLKVVGAFLGLSRARSDARRYPAIDPLESWSKYASVCPEEKLQKIRDVLQRGNDVAQMMKVVGEEGTPLNDFVTYLKTELVDSVYLQQNSFHDVDGATSADRQRHMFALLCDIIDAELNVADRDAARAFFHNLTQTMRDWNYMAQKDGAFTETEATIRGMINVA